MEQGKREIRRAHVSKGSKRHMFETGEQHAYVQEGNSMCMFWRGTACVCSGGEQHARAHAQRGSQRAPMRASGVQGAGSGAHSNPGRQSARRANSVCLAAFASAYLPVGLPAGLSAACPPACICIYSQKGMAREPLINRYNEPTPRRALRRDQPLPRRIARRRSTHGMELKKTYGRRKGEGGGIAGDRWREEALRLCTLRLVLGVHGASAAAAAPVAAPPLVRFCAEQVRLCGRLRLPACLSVAPDLPRLPFRDRLPGCPPPSPCPRFCAGRDAERCATLSVCPPTPNSKRENARIQH
eukprot:351935-Chlamydomonas_euryale.AAC.5